MNISHKKLFAACFAVLGITALVSQYVFSIYSTHPPDVRHITVRYFSFFTVLTNWVVALYFTYQALKKRSYSSWIDRPGVLTALCGYIIVVGLVYNLILRQIFKPQGFELVLEETFHTVVPLCTVFFWYHYERAQRVPYSLIPLWLVYPLIYAGYTLAYGHISGFYPYPFINVSVLGIDKVLVNMFVLLISFMCLFTILLRLSRRLHS